MLYVNNTHSKYSIYSSEIHWKIQGTTFFIGFIFLLLIYILQQKTDAPRRSYPFEMKFRLQSHLE